jgi:signal transduction histidine kinase
VLLAACLAALGILEIVASSGVDRWLAGPLVTLAAAALAWRRRLPLTSLLVTSGVISLSAVLAAPIDSFAVVVPLLAVSLYSLGAHGAPRRAVAGLAFCVVVVFVATFAEDGPGVGNLMFGLVVAGGPWLAGWMVRRRSTEQALALALRAQELEHHHAKREQAAVLRERTRIARELHDVISHSVSVMTIQAGALEEVLDRDPGKARAAAAAIRRTGKQSQVDLRRMLEVLREEDAGEHGLSPQPGLADLEELVRCGP